MASDLKLKTARTIKWNTIDRVSTQVLYAVVGVVLANILTHEEFGLVGALAIFQAFAIIFVDCGFGAALLREKSPTQRDYSTVFWFNLQVSLVVYLLLFVGAPMIARLFDNNPALIPMSKVMFLTFVINGLAIVQTNRLMKMMEVKMIAVSNIVAIIASGIIGVVLALMGFGAWAMVWYSVSMAAVKSAILWLTGGWMPSLCFSRESMRKIRRVGLSVFTTSLLNTVSQNVYNFVIGVKFGLKPLGVYTQADKYSKMGSASISQVLTSSFVPLLSKVQDNEADFRRYAEKTGRFTAFIVLPAMLLLTACADNLFHTLFATKWDAAILLFQLLCVRGIFVVMLSLCNNYLLAMGKARHLVVSEGVKDGLLLLAIVSTVGFGSVPTLIVGLLVATLITWVIQLIVTAHGLPLSITDLLRPLLPFLLPTLLMIAAMTATDILLDHFTPALGASDVVARGGDANGSDSAIRLTALIHLIVQVITGVLTYAFVCLRMRLPEITEALNYITPRK